MTAVKIEGIEPKTRAYYHSRAARYGRTAETEMRLTLEQFEQREKSVASNPKTGKDIALAIQAMAAEIGGADDFAEILDNLPRDPMPEPMSFTE